MGGNLSNTLPIVNAQKNVVFFLSTRELATVLLKVWSLSNEWKICCRISLYVYRASIYHLARYIIYLCVYFIYLHLYLCRIIALESSIIVFCFQNPHIILGFSPLISSKRTRSIKIYIQIYIHTYICIYFFNSVYKCRKTFVRWQCLFNYHCSEYINVLD